MSYGLWLASNLFLCWDRYYKSLSLLSSGEVSTLRRVLAPVTGFQVSAVTWRSDFDLYPVGHYVLSLAWNLFPLEHTDVNPPFL